MTLVQKYALLPDEIDRRSLEEVAACLPGDDGLTPGERYVVHRIVRAEGDPAIADAVVFGGDAVARGVAALRAGAAVATDVRMVEVGISQALLARGGIATHCRIAAPETARRAAAENTTRSIAAIRELRPHLDGSIAAVGNAPTALLALLDLIAGGQVRPALVVGMPVGFIACAESKEELLEAGVPFITIRGRRGGSSAAAATVNALLGLALEGNAQ